MKKKKRKLFSIRVNELFEPIALRKKGRRVFALFNSNFLKNRSLSNAIDFTIKLKIGKGNLHLTKIDYKVETKCGVRQIITIIYVTFVQRDF